MTSNVSASTDPVYPISISTDQKLSPALEGAKVLTASVMENAKTKVKQVAGENLTLKVEIEDLKNTNSELEKKIKELED